jgi:DNA-binding transcriptional LysR family regulator
MELRQLRYFVAVADTLHFGRAAERLGITQPPLSQQIQALEQAIGARLFHRTNRRVELTEAGRAFLQETRVVLERLDRAAEQAARIHRGEAGELRLGFTVSAPFTDIFAHSIQAFRHSHPAVNLALREMRTVEQIAALVEGRLDLGLIRPATLPEAVTALELLREPLVIVMRSDHPAAQGDPAEPVSLKTFANEDFLLFPQAAGFSFVDQILRLCQRAGFKPRVVQEAREASTQIALVAAGFGVAVMPALQQRIQLDSVSYRPLDDPEAHTAVWLAWRREDNSPLVRAFTQLVAARLKPR